jgi:hypothetical protein
VDRVIDVSFGAGAIKRRPIIAVERQPKPEAFNEIGIRDKMPAERNQIRIAFIEDFHRSFAVKAARRNHRPVKNLAKAGLCRSETRPIVNGVNILCSVMLFMAF